MNAESDIELLKQGKLLPLMEQFYSLQGEGFHTGSPAWFVRIGGCDVGCRWCDEKESWNAGLLPLTSVDEMVAGIEHNPSKAVVVTGGEPLQYNLGYLCAALKEKNINTYLETSGTCLLTGEWDWICLSPKKTSPPLPNILLKANELKVIIHEPSDLHWAEVNSDLVERETHLFLQPEWSRRKEMIPLVIEYILNNPQWSISLQTHKYMNIP